MPDAENDGRFVWRRALTIDPKAAMAFIWTSSAGRRSSTRKRAAVDVAERAGLLGGVTALPEAAKKMACLALDRPRLSWTMAGRQTPARLTAALVDAADRHPDDRPIRGHFGSTGRDDQRVQAAAARKRRRHEAPRRHQAGEFCCCSHDERSRGRLSFLQRPLRLGEAQPVSIWAQAASTLSLVWVRSASVACSASARTSRPRSPTPFSITSKWPTSTSATARATAKGARIQRPDGSAWWCAHADDGPSRRRLRAPRRGEAKKRRRGQRRAAP